MDTQLYEFPPPVWQNQNWSVASVLVILVGGVILPLVVARYSKPTNVWVLGWAVVTVIAAAAVPAKFNAGILTYDPYRYWCMLPLCITAIGFGLLMKFWYQSAAWCGPVEAAILVVFALILLAIIVPAPQMSGRGSAYQTKCRNNLRLIALGMHTYHDVYESFPDPSGGDVPISWRVTLIPYIEGSKLWERYDRKQPWDALANEPHQFEHVSYFDCPSGPPNFDIDGRFLTSYVVPTAQSSIFADGVGSGLKTITDGTSNTLLVVESCNSRIIWTEPRDGDSSPSAISINQPGREKGLSGSLLSSWHSGGSQVALADGSVRYISAETDPAILQALMSKAGKEAVGDW